MNIDSLRTALARGLVYVTDHADEEANNDSLLLEEVYKSLCAGEVIEDYPTDRPYPSCLVMGHNRQNKPIHSVWAYNEDTGFCVLVTVYRPDPERWYDGYKKRR